MNVRITIAFIIAVAGVAFSHQLLSVGRVGELSFITLVGLFIFVALVVAFIDRIQSFSLRDLRVEMAKVESARKEVEEREREVRRIAMALSEITMFLAAFHRRLGSEESHQLELEWLKKKATGLLTRSAATDAERAHLSRFVSAVEEMDRLKDTDKKASAAKWETIWRGIRDEIEKS